MQKITKAEFERLKKSPKKEVLEALMPFVMESRGRPKSSKPALTPYERVKRYRERLKKNRD
jgi:hypothetical protein